MGNKYFAGDKVRIKALNVFGRPIDPKIQAYNNMTGEIIEATNIVGFLGENWLNLKETGEHITIYHYTVKIGDQIILRDVLEECLEIVK